MGKLIAFKGPIDPFFNRLETIIEMVENIPDDGECLHLNFLYARLLESKSHYERFLEFYDCENFTELPDEEEEVDPMEDGSVQLELFNAETYCPTCLQPYAGCVCLYGEEDESEED